MIRFAENLNKMITAGLGGALEAPRTEVAVGHRVIYTEASGAVVNFESNVVAPVKNLRVTMEPIQDLHGQANPYPAGGGKNKFFISTSRAAYTWPDGCGFSAISVGDSAITFNGTASESHAFYIPNATITLPSGSYVLSQSVTGKVQITLKKTVTEDVVVSTLSLASFTLTEDTTVDIYFTVMSGASFSNQSIGFQIESGSTATTYAPYSNICPITGRDSVRVWRESAYDPNADPALTVQLGQTVYGGTLDISTGKLTVTHGEIASYNGEVLTGEWISDRDVYAAGTTPTIGAQVVYVLDTPQTIDLDPQQITTLKGANNVWSNSGDVALKYPYYEETEGY